MSRFDGQAVMAALEAQVRAQVPTEALVTRHHKRLDAHPDSHQAAGVYTLLIGPRSGYNYEYRPGELPKVEIYIYAERILPGDDPGPALDEAEDEMIRFIETVASEAPAEDVLAPLVLDQVIGSMQTTSPVASVFAKFIYGVDR